MNPNEPNYQQPPAPVPPVPNQPLIQVPTPPAFTTPSVAQDSIYSAAPNPAPAPTVTAPQDPYTFIMNPATPAAKKTFGMGMGGRPMQLLMAIGGIGVVIVVCVIVFVGFFMKGDNSLGLTTIVQKQQELIRIATLGEHQASTETAKTLSYNVDLSISTSQDQLMAYLAKRGTTVTEKELSLKKDSATDLLLTNAKSTSTYESALQKVIAAQLEDYVSDLKIAYDDATSNTLKEILVANYKAGETLLAQANTAMSESD